MTGRAIPVSAPYDERAVALSEPNFESSLGMSECSTEISADLTYEVRATGRDIESMLLDTPLGEIPFFVFLKCLERSKRYKNRLMKKEQISEKTVPSTSTMQASPTSFSAVFEKRNAVKDIFAAISQRFERAFLYARLTAVK